MHTQPSEKDMRSTGEFSTTDGAQLLDGSEVKAARAWFAAICRKDFSAAIREFTRSDGVDVWTIRWGGQQNLFIGAAGQSLSSLLIHAMRTDTQRAD